MIHVGTPSRCVRVLPLLVGVLLFTPGLPAEDAAWSQFRGNNSSGIASGTTPPVEFGPDQNELWRIPLPSGHSSPAIHGNRLFVTTYDAEEKKLQVVCIDRKAGQILWQQPVPAADIETGHPSFNPASGTPATDGERVVTYFGSFGLICFDNDGNTLWDIPMPLAKTYCGNAASPIIAGNQVILYRGNYVDHYLLAVDKTTGEQIWKVPQAEKYSTDMSSTGTPIVLKDRLILHTARAIQAVELKTGEQLWTAGFSTTATSTPVLSGSEVIVATWNQTGESSLTPKLPAFDELVEEHDTNGDGLIARDEFPRLMMFHRSEGTDAPQNGMPIRYGTIDGNRDKQIDADEWKTTIKFAELRRMTYSPHGVVAIDTASSGILEQSQIRYLARDGVPEVPSPIAANGRIYFVKNGGILTEVDIASGERLGRIRTGGRATHYASPVIASGRLYSTAGDGRISVVELEPKLRVLGTNDMQSPVYATPAIVDGTIYVRTHSALHAFATP